MALTLKDVALLAGVSPGTVSKVINNERYVKTETRARVLAAIAELDYRPSLYASTLRNNRSYTVGIVTERPLIYEYVSSALTGLLEQFSKDNLAALVMELDEHGDSIPEILSHFRRRHVDGVVYIGSGFTTLAAINTSGWEPLCVYLFSQPETPDGLAVMADDVQGAVMGTQHLIDLGHRRIAFVGGPSESYVAKDRFLGFQRAMRLNNLEIAGDLVRHGRWEEEHGFASVFDLIAMRAEFTAVFGANDFIAAGAMHALQVLGRRVPADVAVLGFDDHIIARVVRPRLTTVALPSREIGREGARLLVARIAGTPVDLAVTSLPCRLIVRQSTAAT